MLTSWSESVASAAAEEDDEALEDPEDVEAELPELLVEELVPLVLLDAVAAPAAADPAASPPSLGAVSQAASRPRAAIMVSILVIMDKLPFQAGTTGIAQ